VVSPFSSPSAVLLGPWASIGEASDIGLAAVSPVRDAFDVSIRGAVVRAFWLRGWVGEAGNARSSFWLEGALEEGGVNSVTVVEVDMLLDNDSSVGAANALDATEASDSCELGKSGLYSGVTLGVAVLIVLVPANAGQCHGCKRKRDCGDLLIMDRGVLRGATSYTNKCSSIMDDRVYAAAKQSPSLCEP
jgi:hypothetical protein